MPLHTNVLTKYQLKLEGTFFSEWGFESGDFSIFQDWFNNHTLIQTNSKLEIIITVMSPWCQPENCVCHAAEEHFHIIIDPSLWLTIGIIFLLVPDKPLIHITIAKICQFFFPFSIIYNINDTSVHSVFSWTQIQHTTL